MLLIIFWYTGTISFPLQEIMPSAFTALNPCIMAFGDVMLMCLGLWTLRSRLDIALLISLILIGFASKQLNDVSFLSYVNGMRQYVDLVFILSIIRYLLATRTRIEYFLPIFEKNMYWFLLLQFPAMIYQFLRWSDYDYVGGTLGWMMSGPISTLLYVISFYFMVRRWDKSLTYLENLKHNWMLIVCLMPSMLNETKISFIYILLYFVLLVPFDRNYLKRLVYVVPLGLVITVGAIAIYNKNFDNPYEEGRADKISIDEYVMGDDNIREAVLDGTMETVIPYVEEEAVDLARGIKLLAIPMVMSSEPHGWVVGFGPSQFKGNHVMGQSDFSKDLEWLLMGTTITVMMILIDLGLLGGVWMICYIMALFRAFRRVRKREMRITIFMLVIFLMVMFYMAMHQTIPLIIIFTFIIMLSSRWGLLKHVPVFSGWMLPPVKKYVCE